MGLDATRTLWALGKASAQASGPVETLGTASKSLGVGNKPDFDIVVGGLGETWEIRNNTYKPYTCGVVLNPVIEACLALHKTPGLGVNAIERMTRAEADSAIRLCSEGV